jgi:sigma-B regulation protein RsbU (phosphoserine phosphatase)
MNDRGEDNIGRTLEGSAAVMRTLLESASEGIVVVDREGRIVLVNARAEEMFGYPRRELLGRSIGLLLPARFEQVHRGHCAGYLRHPRQRPMGVDRALFARRKDGSEFPVEVSLSFAEVEGALYATSLISDASERVRAQEAIRAYSERLEHMVEERTAELRRAQARLLAQERAQHELELAQRDLELAQQVQASLLPRRVPAIEGYQFAAAARPARYVSGDLYDIFPCDGETCHLVLADIAGKGVPAALLASTARTLVRAETERHDSPASILASVNRALYEDLDHAEGFLTILAARLDTRLGRLTYASAGHAEALWWQAARRACRGLPATGLPLGIEREGALHESSIALRPGDVLLFYSDGVTEAEDAAGALYGRERLERLLAEKAALPAQALAEAIVDAVESFGEGRPRSDDLTLIVLKVLPRTVAFRYPATLDHLDEITALVHHVAAAYGDDYAYQIELAACEVVTNVMRHACHFQGEVRGRLTVRPDEMQVDLYDEGEACDLEAMPAPRLGELREGGYGLHIARSLVDQLTCTAGGAPGEARPDEARPGEAPAGNHWRLVKRAG